MVPVDSFVGELVYRLRFLRFLDPLPADGRLLARPLTKEARVGQLRDSVSPRLSLHVSDHRKSSFL